MKQLIEKLATTMVTAGVIGLVILTGAALAGGACGLVVQAFRFGWRLVN